MASVLTPTAIIFGACQGLRFESDGTITVVGLLNTLSLSAIDGATDFSVLTIWVGGVGSFVQGLDIVDADGRVILSDEQELETEDRRAMVVAHVRVQMTTGAGDYEMALSVDGTRVAAQPLTVSVRPPA